MHTNKGKSTGEPLTVCVRQLPEGEQGPFRYFTVFAISNFFQSKLSGLGLAQWKHRCSSTSIGYASVPVGSEKRQTARTITWRTGGGSTRVKRSVIAMYANDASNVSEAEEGDAELHKWRAGAASRL